MSTGYLHTLGHHVREFDKHRPSYLKSSEELLEDSSKIIKALNLKFKHRFISKDLTISMAIHLTLP